MNVREALSRPCTILLCVFLLGGVSVTLAQPEGDTCQFPIVIPAGPLPITVAGTTEGFSNDTDSLDCGVGDGPDVVYVFVPDEDMIVDIGLCGSPGVFDAVLYVYDDCGVNEIACNDDFCGVLSKITSLPLFAGVPYFIVVDGFGPCDFGEYILTINDTEGNCSRPVVNLDMPELFYPTDSVIEIIGAAHGNHFDQWRLWFAGGDVHSLQSVGYGFDEVVDGKLTDWDTSGLAPGPYTLWLYAWTECATASYLTSLTLGFAGDMNRDGVVNLLDFVIFAEQWLMETQSIPFVFTTGQETLPEESKLKKPTKEKLLFR